MPIPASAGFEPGKRWSGPGNRWAAAVPASNNQSRRKFRQHLDKTPDSHYNRAVTWEWAIRQHKVGYPTKKPLIGVLGGVASGKSTVAAEFGKLGCAVVDADAIAHQLLAEDRVRGELVRLFGLEIVDASGRIDRKKLADTAFSDRERLRALENVIHPRVLQRTEELIRQYNQEPHVKAIVLDMPLLVEVGWAQRCDKVVFVACDRRRRMERAKAKKLLDESDIKIRENFQISLDRKVGLADNTIDNNSDFSALVRQTKDIFSDITKKS